jgi:hypothetical protein
LLENTLFSLASATRKRKAQKRLQLEKPTMQKPLQAKLK